MTLTLIISGLTILSLVLSVLFKPYIEKGHVRIGLYWTVCLIGGIAILISNCLPLSVAIDGIMANTSVNPLKILTLFLSMTLISEFLDDAGFFEYVANRIFLRTKNGSLKLFLIIYFTVAFLTIITSNDIIILTFTPAICIFSKKAKISPLPFLIGEFVAANTWSTMLIVGNPTNVYLAQSFGIGFFDYFKVMWLPSIVGGVCGLLVLLLIFRKQLLSHTKFLFDGIKEIKIKKAPLIIALVHLALCLVALAVSDFIGVEMYLICLIACLSLTLINLVYGLIKDRSVKALLHTYKKAPYELIPFVLSMFVIVLALDYCGFTTLVSNLLVTGEKTDSISFGFLSALASNLLNNIPMSVLAEKIIASKSVYALFGSVIGSNVGAFITPIGALAGIMWNKILRSYKVKLSFGKFVLYGTAVAIPTLLAMTATLYFVL
ncbi:MAG: hypothetical protein E7369_02835 [Clostridiales bacterium]|nr:hypothetical protein [Clostridiales bacterium]